MTELSITHAYVKELIIRTPYNKENSYYSGVVDNFNTTEKLETQRFEKMDDEREMLVSVQRSC